MPINKNELIILLTGSITPNSSSNIKLKDPATRREQYLQAVKFYIQRTDFKIVFAENSGDLLDSFPYIPDRIEYISFQSLPTMPDRGIGYKELEIIDFALKHSKFLKETKSIVKITGRLQVLNLNTIAAKFLKLNSNKSNLVYAHPFELKNMDSRCFFFTLDFWPYLKKAGDRISLQYNFELSLWDAIAEYKEIENRNFVPLNIPLRIKGMSGSYGIKYKHSIFIHGARFIRNLLHRIF